MVPRDAWKGQNAAFWRSQVRLSVLQGAPADGESTHSTTFLTIGSKNCDSGRPERGLVIRAVCARASVGHAAATQKKESERVCRHVS